MKKGLLLFAFVVMGISAFAQLPSFNFGIKAGVNSSKLSTDFASESNRLGYQVGVWSRIGAAGLYLQPELYIGSKGTKFFNAKNEDNGAVINEEAKIKFTTLDVPVLLGTKVGLGLINVRLMAGPVISFVLSDDKTFSNAYNQIKDFDDYKNQTWGIQGGAGVDISRLSLDVRYEAGLSNISNSDKYDQKTNLWHFSLGYKIF